MSKREKHQIVMPPGCKPWDGEVTIAEYLDKHYPKRENESDVQRLERHIKRCQGEPDAAYLLRVAEDPLWVTSITQWAPFRCVIERPRFGVGDRLKADIVNLLEAQEFYRVFGQVMKAKINAMKEMGWMSDQQWEKEGRYASFLIKNILHDVWKKCGILSRMTIYMSGESFYHTNTVLPQPTKRSLPGIYNPGTCGFWTGLVSNRKHRVGFMTIGENQLCMEPLTDSTTSDMTRRNRWERYQFILHAYFGTDGVLSIRGWIGAQEFMEQAELREIDVDIDVNTESDELVNVDGRNRKVKFTGKISKSKKIPMYVLPLGKLHPAIDLFRALQGFDETLLAPRNSAEKD